MTMTMMVLLLVTMIRMTMPTLFSPLLPARHDSSISSVTWPASMMAMMVMMMMAMMVMMMMVMMMTTKFDGWWWWCLIWMLVVSDDSYENLHTHPLLHCLDLLLWTFLPLSLQTLQQVLHWSHNHWNSPSCLTINGKKVKMIFNFVVNDPLSQKVILSHTMTSPNRKLKQWISGEQII